MEKESNIFKYASSSERNNIILSNNARVGIDQKINLNTLIVGGAGTGKSTCLTEPNLLQANCNYVIIDHSGVLYSTYSKFFASREYDVKCIDLYGCNDIESNHFNPFSYIKGEDDIVTLVETIMMNTGAGTSDVQNTFWYNTEKLLLNTVLLYMYETLKPEEMSFDKALKLLNLAGTNIESFDLLFEDVKNHNKNSSALAHYETFRKGADKTTKSVILSAIQRLQLFMLEPVKNILNDDELELDTFDQTPRVLFLIVSSSNITCNCLISVIQQQLISLLSKKECKRHVRFIMEENNGEVVLPDLDYMHLYLHNISVAYYVHSITQLNEDMASRFTEYFGIIVWLLGGGLDDTSRDFLFGKVKDKYNKRKNEEYDNDKEYIYIKGIEPYMDGKYNIRNHPLYCEIKNN